MPGFRLLHEAHGVPLSRIPLLRSSHRGQWLGQSWADWLAPIAVGLWLSGLPKRARVGPVCLTHCNTGAAPWRRETGACRKMPSALWTSPWKQCINYPLRPLFRVTFTPLLLRTIWLYTRSTVVRSCRLSGSTMFLLEASAPHSFNLFSRVARHSTTELQYPHTVVQSISVPILPATTGRFVQPGVEALSSKHEGSCRSCRKCLASSILPQHLQHHMRRAHLERLVTDMKW
jgi:hypothetical protein